MKKRIDPLFLGLALIAGTTLALSADPKPVRSQSTPARPTVTQAVAEHFFPKKILTADGEDCLAPATIVGKGPKSGIAYYSAVTHPDNPAATWLVYALTFNYDCGESGHLQSFGAEHHQWDVEYFSYTLETDSTCPNGIRAHAMKTRSHSGDWTLREINERILGSCNGADEIVMSLGKHALFMSWLDCTKRPGYCSGAKKERVEYNLYDFQQYATFDTSVKQMLTPKAQRQLGNPAAEFPSKMEHPHPGIGDNPPKCAGDARCIYGLQCSQSLCYKGCDEGYTGNGPICYQDCPDGWKGKSDLLSCYKHREDRSPHTSKHNCQQDGKHDCNKHGALWYRRCDDGYSWDGSGCSADCKGMTDTGAFCTKKSKPRGIGILP